MVTDDLELESRSVDIIGLYLHPPQHAAVFCVDQTTTFQAPDPLVPTLSTTGIALELPRLKSYLHGTLSLCAAFDAGVGEAPHASASRHTSSDFVAFLNDVVLSQPQGKEIHVIADNLEAHRTMQVNDLLHTHQTVHLHLIPSYLAWLTQIEEWLSKIDRDIDVCGVLNSGSCVKSKLMRCIRNYNKAPKTLNWKYFHPACRLMIESDGAIH